MENNRKIAKSETRIAAWRHVKRLGSAMMVIAPMVLVLAACGGGSGNGAAKAPASPAATTAAQESNPAYVKANELFTTNKCISCHGVDLEGRAGPKTNLQKAGTAFSKEQIANQIKNGGGGMPGYKSKLSDEEVGLLTDWLSSKK